MRLLAYVRSAYASEKNGAGADSATRAAEGGEAARPKNLRKPSRKLKKEQKKTLSPLSEDRALKTQTNKHKSVAAKVNKFCIFPKV